MLMPNPGGMEIMDILLMAMATTGRDLPMRSQQLMLTLNLGGMDTTDILLTAMATTGRGLLMPSLTLMLTLSLGGMETMDTTATLLTAMATMERGLLMLSLLQMPNLPGVPGHGMAEGRRSVHETEPKWIMAKPKILITRKITILASSYCYLSS